MACANWVVLFLFISLVSAYGEVQNDGEVGRGEVRLRLYEVGRRILMGFKETPNGGNVTYDCSPSGPCVYCAYSEKNDEKYRCSETGYHIPLKCVDTVSKKPKDRSALERKDAEVKHVNELDSSITQRSLLDDSVSLEGDNQVYITYRSCIPAVSEERLSVLGFEEIMLGLLLMSGSIIYLKRKRANAVPNGAVRVANNSRF